MMRKILFLLMMALPSWMQAQQLKDSGASIKELVPTGWEVTEAEGDLNKDGVADLAVIVTPDHKDHLKVRDDGYVYNFNTPILAIYTGLKEGGYCLWGKYDDILPARPDEFTSIDHVITITDKGVLRIGVSNFSSAGGWSSPSTTYVLRLQNGDFYLIGKDEDTFARNTGEGETVSYNYLTHKCQRVIYNQFDDKVKPRETWSRLPNKPLQRLGTFEMTAE